MSWEWDETLVQELRKLVRNEKFQFDNVSFKISEFATAILQRKVVISPSECREKFALDYKFEEICTSTESLSALDDSDVIETLEMEYDTDREESFQEVMRRIDAQEEANFKRKEAIFGRVLASLGISSSTSGTARMEFETLSELETSFRDAHSKRMAEKAKIEQKIAEAAEREALNQQRMQLSKRFEKGSEDSQGVAFELGSTALTTAGGTEIYDDAGLNLSTQAYASQLETLNISDVFESDEFDAILTALEDDINATAQGKDAESVNSELEEVLKILEEAPRVSASASAVTKSAASVAPPRAPVLTGKAYPQLHTILPPLPPAPSVPIPSPVVNMISQPANMPHATLDRSGRPVFGLHEAKSGGDDDDDDDDDADDNLDDDWSKKRAAMKIRSHVPAEIVEKQPAQQVWGMYTEQSSMTRLSINFESDDANGEENGGESSTAGSSEVQTSSAEDISVAPVPFSRTHTLEGLQQESLGETESGLSEHTHRSSSSLSGMRDSSVEPLVIEDEPVEEPALHSVVTSGTLLANSERRERKGRGIMASATRGQRAAKPATCLPEVI